jgi:uncharacterized membrane protein
MGTAQQNREPGDRRSPFGTMRAAVCLALLAGWGVSVATPAQTPPDRALATAFATTAHAAFPLVAASATDEIRIPLAELVDRAAHYYTFMVGILPVEFFAIWTDDNVIRAALNACDICYRAKLGYRQDGAFMVCNNCGNRFPVDRIAAVAGGCNPVPLATRIDGLDLAILVSALEAGLASFPSM